MKKLTLLLSAMLLACATSVWADVATLTFTKACGGSGTDDKKNTWTVTSDVKESTYDGTKGIHYGTNSAAVSYLSLTNNTIAGTITKIVVNASGASKTSAKLDVTVGGATFGSQQSLTSTATEYTFEGSATGEIVVKLSQTSAKKALYVKSIAVTYSTDAATVATPVLTAEDGKVAGGEFFEAFQLTMTCETAETTILYTLDESDPKTSETAKTYAAAITISETTTVRAIAKAGEEWSREATETYTKVVALTTMDEIFETATEAGKNNTVTKYVTFNDWIVTGVKGSNAYLTDGTKGLIIFTSSHGFKAGDMLSGTVSCDITLYNGSAEIKGLNANTTGLTVTEGGIAPVQTPAIKDLSAINTGSIISLSNLTYDGTVLVDAEENKITPYNAFITLPTMTKDKKYNVKGVFINFGETKEIAPLAESDIQEVTTPSAIESAAVETPALKTIENGQLIILRDGVKYNAMGVRLQ